MNLHKISRVFSALLVTIILLLPPCVAQAKGIHTCKPFMGSWQCDEIGTLLVLAESSKASNLSLNCYQYCDERYIPLEEFSGVLQVDSGKMTLCGDGSLLYDGHAYSRCAIDPKLSLWQSNSPQEVFSAVCNTFRQYYAFAPLRGIDLEAYIRQYQSKIENEELYPTLVEFLRAFGDSHLSLTPSLESEEGVYFDHFSESMKPYLSDIDPWESIEQWREGAFACIQQHYIVPLGIHESFFCGVMKQNPQVGYLNVTGLEDLDIEAVDRFLLELRNRGIKKLVIDIRFNLGGDDLLGKQIADRFTDSKRLAYTTQNYFAAGQLSDPVLTYVEPIPNVSYPDYSLIVLTSPMTASAAEAFAQMLHVLPNATLVGQPTMGILSDQFLRKLPNGWWITLSNQLRSAPDGSIYEKVGVPVDCEGPLISIQDIQHHRDPLLDQVLKRA